MEIPERSGFRVIRPMMGWIQALWLYGIFCMCYVNSKFLSLNHFSNHHPTGLSDFNLFLKKRGLNREYKRCMEWLNRRLLCLCRVKHHKDLKKKHPLGTKYSLSISACLCLWTAIPISCNYKLLLLFTNAYLHKQHVYLNIKHEF